MASHPVKSSSFGRVGKVRAINPYMKVHANDDSCGVHCTQQTFDCFAQWQNTDGSLHTSETGQMNNYMQENGWWTN